MLNVFMLSVVMLIVMFLYCYTECHYAEFPNDEFSAECLLSCFYIVILSVVILNVCHSVTFPPTFWLKTCSKPFQ
jgi:uncharacterized membrane protein YozB (DUF420 family)